MLEGCPALCRSRTRSPLRGSAGFGGFRGSRAPSAPLRRWRRNCGDRGIGIPDQNFHFLKPLSGTLSLSYRYTLFISERADRTQTSMVSDTRCLCAHRIPAELAPPAVTTGALLHLLHTARSRRSLFVVARTIIMYSLSPHSCTLFTSPCDYRPFCL